jgi:F0F1-type ATP synthase epsilon subunit
MLKPIGIQYVYKKQIGFTKQQQSSLKILEDYGVNVNQFIRQAIKEKLQRDWPKIKEKKETIKNPF